nr:hypothetical protein [Tanacetum cinerariifolium]
MNENLTNQEQAKGKKAHVYTDEDHYYEQEAEEQRLWKVEDERERRQQQKQRREEHWKAVRALIEPKKVKEKQEKDKIRTKPDKNGKRGEAQQCRRPVTVEKARKMKKIQSGGTKNANPTSCIT